MPTVAILDGIKIEFYYDEHPPPHFHARYAEHIIQIDIETLDVIKGFLPPAQRRKVLEWAALQGDHLIRAWLSCAAGRVPEKFL